MEELKKMNALGFLPDQDRVNSLLKDITNDKALMDILHELGIQDEEIPSYLPLLATYQDNQKEVKKDPNTLQMVLEISDAGKLTCHYEETETAKEERRLIENYYLRDFSDDWLVSSLKSFRTAREKEFKKHIALSLKGDYQNWFYVYGPLGTGKSFALAAFLNDRARKGKKVAFLNANKRFDELKGLAIKDKTKFDQTMQELSSLDCLAIDDFGSEFKSDYVRDQIVIPLLMERSKKHKITLFASDYSLSEVEQLYNTRYGANILARKLADIIRNNLKPEEGEYHLERGLENFASR